MNHFFKVQDRADKRAIDINCPWLVYENNKEELNKWVRIAERMSPDEINIKIDMRTNKTEMGRQYYKLEIYKDGFWTRTAYVLAHDADEVRNHFEGKLQSILKAGGDFRVTEATENGIKQAREYGYSFEAI